MSSMNPLPDFEFSADPEGTIGHSHLGVPLTIQYFGSPAAPLRILLICGQHGDERGIRRALTEFLNPALPPLLRELPNVQLAVLAEANPDGAARRSRANAQGRDLNRDHLLLETPEVRAIHRFVDHWHPNVVVDLHNFPSRRAHLVSQHLRFGWDVCLDYPSNPATGMGEGHPLVDSLMSTLATALSPGGYRFGRYCLLDAKGVMRHSTPQLVDARNVLALRYGALTLLLEARNPSRSETKEQRRHVRAAVAAACTELVRWCARHEAELRELKVDGGVQPTCPLRFRRRWSTQPAAVPVVRLGNDEPGSLQLPLYRCSIQGRRTVTVPDAYAVSRTQPALLDVLSRQGFRSYTPQPAEWFTVEETRIEPRAQIPQNQGAQIPYNQGDGVKPTGRRASRDAHLHMVRYERRLEDSVLFPMAQLGGRCLPLILEVESACALHRHASLAISTAPGTVYPVARVMESGRRPELLGDYR